MIEHKRAEERAEERGTDNRFWSHRKTVTIIGTGVTERLMTRLLGRRGHSLSQHTQFLKNNMKAENGFFMKL